MSPSSPDPTVLAALLAAVADQDQRAFASLYDQLQARVYAIAMRVLRNSADAEEITLDVFKQIWRSARNYSAERGTVLSWCATITYSRAIDCYRRRKLPEVAEVLHPQAIDQAYPDDLSPVDAAVHSDVRDLLQQALSQLSPVRRQLISLAFFEGLSHEDIAERTGIPLGTVKSHVRRGLQQVRDFLAPYHLDGAASHSANG